MTCGNTSDVKEEIDTEFQELFAQTSDKTTIDECVDFDFETVTSEPAVNTQNEDLGQESRERSIAEVIHLDDFTSSVDESESSISIEVDRTVFVYIFFYKRYFKSKKHKQKHLS